MLDQDFITALIGLPEFHAIDAEFTEDGTVLLAVALAWDAAICPECSRPSASVLEYVPRLSRDLSLSGRRVYLGFEQRRFRCLHCQRSFLEGLPSIASPGAPYTKRYEEWIVRQVNHSNVQRVAQQEGLSWESVQRILQRVAEQEGLLKPPAVVRWVAFDEIALKKRHQQYALVVSAPEEARILAVLEGRTKEDLCQWLEQTWTAAQRAEVEVVSIDMWDAYFYAAIEKLPQALIVVDRFHVEKNLLEAITKLRRQIQSGLSAEAQQSLKGTRWLLVSNYDELDTAQKEKLDQALESCPELALCHHLKEAFRDWYEEDDEIEVAGRKLEQWKELAVSVGSRALNNFVKTVGNWQGWILNYFVERATNGFAEGINNALQLLKRSAYGFRNFANFRLRALLLHAFP